MWTELKRIAMQPVFWMVLLGSLAVNGWMLANYAHQRGLVLASAEASGQLGLVSADTIPAYEERLREFDSDLEGVPTAGQMLQGAKDMIQMLQMEDLADAYVSGWKLSGEAEEYAREKFQRLSPLLEQQREQGISAAFFVPCSENFYTLFGRLIPLFCTVEGVLTAVLIIVWCMTEPFSAGTAELVFSTRTGRGICPKKRAAGCVAGVIAAAFLWGVTVAAAAALFPLGRLWQTPVGSMMMLDGGYPLFPEFPVTMASNLMLQAACSLLVVLLFSVFAGWNALYTRSALSSAAELGLACVVIYTAADLFPGTSRFWFAIRWNPVTLAQEAGRWLVNGAASLSTGAYVAGTLFLWGMAAALLTGFRTRKFSGEDI